MPTLPPSSSFWTYLQRLTQLTTTFYKNVSSSPLDSLTHCRFQSYLTNWTEYISMGHSTSNQHTISCGVPQRLSPWPHPLHPLPYGLCNPFLIIIVIPITTHHLSGGDESMDPIASISARPPSTASETFPNSAPFSPYWMQKNWFMPSSPTNWTTVMQFSLGPLAKACRGSKTFKTLQLRSRWAWASRSTSLPSSTHFTGFPSPPGLNIRFPSLHTNASMDRTTSHPTPPQQTSQPTTNSNLLHPNEEYGSWCFLCCCLTF